MAFDCNSIRTNLALQTPHYDEGFLPDWKPMDEAFVGRHQSGVWEDGTSDVHIFDRIQIGQPDLSAEWQQISAAECDNACDPPRTMVGFGTTRNSYYMEQQALISQPFCLTQLRFQTKVSEQISQIYQGIRKIPIAYTADFLRVNAFKRGATVQIADSDFATFTPTALNTSGQLTLINLGGAGNLPESELTLQYLDYLSSILGLQGYDRESGLSAGMRNLVTHSRVWHKLVYANPEIRGMLALKDVQSASILYKLGEGINAEPFGNFVPTFDESQPRFQHLGAGVLQRVFPYRNVATTTGIMREPNPAWVNARYGLSFLWHPKAIKLWTSSPKKIHPQVPTVNSAMMGNWTFVNNQGTLTWTNPDGTTCVKNNDLQLWWYWIILMQLGFEYMRPELVYPILHQIDGSGKDCMVNSPVCGDEPQYAEQDYSDDPTMCET